MIVRLWKARTSAATADEYVRHATQTVFPKVRTLPGHRGEYLLRRAVGDYVELIVLTLWDSMEAIRGFAGDDLEKAVVEPAAQAVLTEFDRNVTHFEVVHSGLR